MRILRTILFLSSLWLVTGAIGALSVNLLDQRGDTSNGTSYSTASFTPTANALIIACVASTRGSAAPDTPSFSNSASFTQSTFGDTLFQTTGTNRGRLSCVAMQASASPASMTISASYTNSCAGVAWQAFEVIGSDVAHGVAQSIIQPTATAQDQTGTSYSITLSAASDSNNRPFSVNYHFVNEAITQRTNWTEIGGADVGFNTPTTRCEAEWRSDTFETTASASWTTSSTYGAIAFEVKALVAGATVFRNRTGSRARTGNL